MLSQRVPRFVYQQMVKYYGYLWTHRKGVTPKSLFVDLPVPMRAEIAVAVTRRMWSKVCRRLHSDSVGANHSPLEFVLGDDNDVRTPPQNSAHAMCLTTRYAEVRILYRTLRRYIN